MARTQLPDNGHEKCRQNGIFRTLSDAYPKVEPALAYKGPWELLVAVILSAQCSDERVNSVTPMLFARYGSPQAMASANPADVEGIIRPTGFFRAKTKSLLGAARIIATRHGGHVPDTMKALCMLPGVARKTANVVLAHGFGKQEGIAVDTHVKRLSQRLRLVDTAHISGKDPVRIAGSHGRRLLDYYRIADTDRIEKGLLSLVPPKARSATSLRLIAHGRAVCHARKPACAACVLCSFCPVVR